MRQVCEMSNPVVIGGVGGSGTRVVAEIIAQMGIYIGDDLDAALDNLWFLLLFKRPKWFRKSQHRKSDIFTGLTLFTKAMFHQRILAWPELKFLFKAVLEVSVRGHNHFGEGRGVWPFVRAWKMLTLKSKGPQKQSRWGWKEPNTHLYLVYLAEYFQASIFKGSNISIRYETDLIWLLAKINNNYTTGDRFSACRLPNHKPRSRRHL